MLEPGTLCARGWCINNPDAAKVPPPYSKDTMIDKILKRLGLVKLVAHQVIVAQLSEQRDAFEEQCYSLKGSYRRLYFSALEDIKRLNQKSQQNA